MNAGRSAGVGKQDLRVRSALRRVPFLANLSDDLFLLLASRCECRSEGPGTRLIKEGRKPEGLFIVLSGQVHVEQQSWNGSLLLGVGGPGAILGEISLFDGGAATASVIAAEEVEVLVLSREAFRHCVQKSPTVSSELLRLVAARLRETDHALLLANSASVLARVAAEVLATILRADIPSDEGVVRLDLTQAQLSRKIGATREAVNKALRQLESTAALTRYGAGRGAYRFVRSALEGIVAAG